MNRLLSRLKHVRLSIGPLLSTLFDGTPKPDVQSNRISGSTDGGLTFRTPDVSAVDLNFKHNRHISEHFSPSQAFPTLHTLIIDITCIDLYRPYRSTPDKDRNDAALIKAAQSAFKAGRFLAVRRFSTFNVLQRTVDPYSFDAIVERDLIAQRSHVNPFFPYAGKP